MDLDIVTSTLRLRGLYYLRGTYIYEENQKGMSTSTLFFRRLYYGKINAHMGLSYYTRWPVSRLVQFQGSWQVGAGGDFRDHLDQFLHFPVRRLRPEAVRDSS